MHARMQSSAGWFVPSPAGANLADHDLRSMSTLAAGLGLTLLLTPSLVVQPASHGGAQQPRAADVHRRHGAPTSIAIPTEPLMRIGHGYDIHRMAPREEVGHVHRSPLGAPLIS